MSALSLRKVPPMPMEYRKSPTGVVKVPQADLRTFDHNVIWIDALNPSDVELEQLDTIMGFEVPNRHDMTEIELSNRLYKEDGALVMIANLLPKTVEKVVTTRPAAFILRRNILLTIRYSEFYSFERVEQRIPIDSELHAPIAIFCRLLEEAVGDRADNLETSMRYLEVLTAQLFINPHREEERLDHPTLDDALQQIGRMGASISNIRESITSLQRVVNYACTYIPESWREDQKFVFDSLKSDLTALADEASFLMNKLSFNLDAILGMINIEEAKVIRLLSVVTLLLSPPMVIAGIYGMNFEIMPELRWPLGYAFALGLMMLIALASIWYLKKKRWM